MKGKCRADRDRVKGEEVGGESGWRGSEGLTEG